MKPIFALTFLVTAFSLAAPDLDPIPVSDFDRTEIRAIHDAAEKLKDRRNILISHAAKRHNVNLEEYDYDIEKGFFFAKDITSPDATSDSNSP